MAQASPSASTLRRIDELLATIDRVLGLDRPEVVPVLVERPERGRVMARQGGPR